ncbi:FecR domain-containing protein [uncultured Aquimarina sp.]|uniref:FecR family protein n=1 Tax=uncultured Aquimarina sp. TaxID=575652 RepID=UPI002633EF23|nr:FecR domain-containing protein [uncultured Aquimarina sp.]
MNNYLTIIKKYLEGELSDSEKEKLRQWILKNPENEMLFKKEIKNWHLEKEELQADSEKAYKSFLNTIDRNEPKVISLKPLLKLISYAAVLAGVLFGVYYYTKPDISVIRTSPNIVEIDTAPEDKIKISQEDGTIAYIDFDDKKDVVDASGIIIGKKSQDQLIIKGVDKTKTEFLEISIPKGKIFQLSLSDGTKVWLNAASTLRFPQHFGSSESNRIVYLEGEAFFDVTTNKKQSFIVKTGDVDVQVLGTQFNVSSYAEDAAVKTTLVEGLVAVNNSNDPTDMLKLSPTYQAVYTKDQNRLNKKKVNTTFYTSWMYRKMMIQNESFAEVLKRLERAYDVEIISSNKKLNKTRFTGEFDIENVRQILNVFSETIDFTYEMNQNKILIHSND